MTPLVSAVYTEDPVLFTALLKEIDCYATRSEGGWLSGDTVRWGVRFETTPWSCPRVGRIFFLLKQMIPHQFNVFFIVTISRSIPGLIFSVALNRAVLKWVPHCMKLVPSAKCSNCVGGGRDSNGPFEYA